MQFLNGKKTWMAAASLVLIGIADIIGGDAAAGVEKIVGSLALVGIGHKLDKTGEKITSPQAK